MALLRRLLPTRGRPGPGVRRAGIDARAVLAALGLLAATTASGVGREPVLSQVSLPHTYYWRELYIPQQTTGPSSLAFMPSGDALVYAMAGSLYVDGKLPPAPDGAAYFSVWMDRVVEAALARGGWNSEQEKTDTLAYLEEERARFRALAATR